MSTIELLIAKKLKRKFFDLALTRNAAAS